MAKRRNYSAAFKAKVALEALYQISLIRTHFMGRIGPPG